MNISPLFMLETSRVGLDDKICHLILNELAMSCMWLGQLAIVMEIASFLFLYRSTTIAYKLAIVIHIPYPSKYSIHLGPIYL